MNLLKNAGITSKVWLLVLIAVVIMLAGGLWNAFHTRDDFLAERKLKTRHLVESAYTVVAHYHALQQSGALDEKAAQEAAAKAVKAMRYDGKEYFWIHDLSAPVPKMIMHATVPALDGKVLDEARFNKAVEARDGKDGEARELKNENLFVAFNQVVERAGEGFVTYLWPRPKAGGGVTDELFPKISYVKKFEPWGWVIGTGIYVDDINTYFWSHASDSLLLAVIGVSLMRKSTP